MAKRRSNGEGTLRLRADGRWEMTIMDGFRDDGKRRFKTFYGKTQKEVKAKAKGYRDAKDSGLLVDVNYLFPEWAEIWFEHHRDNIAPTTQENYRYTLRILNEGFARRRIADVKPYDIEVFLKKLRRYRNVAVAVSGLGCANHRRALDHVDGLADVDAGTVRFDVPWLQSEKLLRPHTGAE